jgi:hypothetical protein
MGSFVGLIVAGATGLVLAVVGAVTAVQLGSTSMPSHQITADVVVYGNR